MILGRKFQSLFPTGFFPGGKEGLGLLVPLYFDPMHTSQDMSRQEEVHTTPRIIV